MKNYFRSMRWIGLGAILWTSGMKADGMIAAYLGIDSSRSLFEGYFAPIATGLDANFQFDGSFWNSPEQKVILQGSLELRNLSTQLPPHPGPGNLLEMGAVLQAPLMFETSGEIGLFCTAAKECLPGTSDPTNWWISVPLGLRKDSLFAYVTPYFPISDRFVTLSVHAGGQHASGLLVEWVLSLGETSERMHYTIIEECLQSTQIQIAFWCFSNRIKVETIFSLTKWPSIRFYGYGKSNRGKPHAQARLIPRKSYVFFKRLLEQRLNQCLRQACLQTQSAAAIQARENPQAFCRRLREGWKQFGVNREQMLFFCWRTLHAVEKIKPSHAWKTYETTCAQAFQTSWENFDSAPTFQSWLSTSFFPNQFKAWAYCRLQAHYDALVAGHPTHKDDLLTLFACRRKAISEQKSLDRDRWVRAKAELKGNWMTESLKYLALVQALEKHYAPLITENPNRASGLRRMLACAKEQLPQRSLLCTSWDEAEWRLNYVSMKEPKLYLSLVAPRSWKNRSLQEAAEAFYEDAGAHMGVVQLWTTLSCLVYRAQLWSMFESTLNHLEIKEPIIYRRLLALIQAHLLNYEAHLSRADFSDVKRDAYSRSLFGPRNQEKLSRAYDRIFFQAQHAALQSLDEDFGHPQTMNHAYGSDPELNTENGVAAKIFRETFHACPMWCPNGFWIQEEWVCPGWRYTSTRRYPTF